MPTFYWKCKECDEKHKTIQKADEKNPSCPSCGKEMKKDFNYKGKSPKVKFNGNGYYDTDKG